MNIHVNILSSTDINHHLYMHFTFCIVFNLDVMSWYLMYIRKDFTPHTYICMQLFCFAHIFLSNAFT